jgi:hypothetical protein
VFPGCADVDGNPRLTDQVICEPCRGRYRRVLSWLVEDYAKLHAELGQLRTPAGVRVRASREFGHPAEHISVWKAEIAVKLNATHEALADERGDLPPPAPAGHAEARLVAAAYRYLSVRFEALCTFGGAEAAASELAELHGRIRSRLGYSRRPAHLPTPCPTCDLLTMYRWVQADGIEWIECVACTRRVSEEEYAFYLRFLLAEHAT